jgi:hypothetical protein
MVSIGFGDSAEGAAGSGAGEDCAAAIPASSKTAIEAARILIEGPPLQQNSATRLQIQMRLAKRWLAEKLQLRNFSSETGDSYSSASPP